jgi:hypothetical protein
MKERTRPELTVLVRSKREEAVCQHAKWRASSLAQAMYGMDVWWSYLLVYSAKRKAVADTISVHPTFFFFLDPQPASFVLL